MNWAEMCGYVKVIVSEESFPFHQAFDMNVYLFTKSYFQTQGNRQYFSKNSFPS